MRTPTERTLKWLRKAGHAAAVVEKWVPVPGHPGGGVRRDVFGADILAILDLELAGTLLIQTTTASNMAARLTKLQGIPECRQWLEAGGVFWIVGWRKIGGLWKARAWSVGAPPNEALVSAELPNGWCSLPVTPGKS